MNVICPGAIDTELLRRGLEGLAGNMGLPDVELLKNHMLQMAALQRYATADEVANTALFLASDDSSGMTGETLTVSAGAATY